MEPRDSVVGLFRDADGWLTAEVERATREQYPAWCRAIAEAHGLVARGAPAEQEGGIDQVYEGAGAAIVLEWNEYQGFVAVAREPAGDPLVRRIADFLADRLGADRPIEG